MKLGVRDRGILLLALMVALGACAGKDDGGERGSGGGKVLVIGVEAVEWDVLRSLAEAGELPRLGRLLDEGVHGPLLTLEPLADPAAIWTTIATGRAPSEHGLRRAGQASPARGATDTPRRTRAVWTILSGLGRTVGVVGWPATWPAETVNGFFVTDFLAHVTTPSDTLARGTYPAALAAEVSAAAVIPGDLDWGFVDRFTDVPVDTATTPRSVLTMASVLRQIAATDMTYARVARELQAAHDPEYLAVHLGGLHAVSRLFWNYMTPEAVPEGSLDAESLRHFGGTVRAYYRFVDELIGPLLDGAGPRTTVIVVSDHGYRGGPGRGPEAWKNEGVLILAGRGVARGEISGANVYDLVPTTLVLAGLPPARDMKGKILWSALDDSISRERFRQLIDTYEVGADGATPESAVDEEVRERLRSLGYID